MYSICIQVYLTICRYFITRKKIIQEPAQQIELLCRLTVLWPPVVRQDFFDADQILQ